MTQITGAAQPSPGRGDRRSRRVVEGWQHGDEVETTRRDDGGRAPPGRRPPRATCW